MLSLFRPKQSSITVLITLLTMLVLFPVAALAQGPNLLQNPGFERPFAPLPHKENCLIAVPWVAYYYEGSQEETSQGYLLAPEYKMATRKDYPGNRVRSGELSQQWFHSFGNFRAGVWQQVSNIPVGTRLRFELWGMAWSCDKESKGNCQGATSGDPSPMHFRIGIDPTGGTDPLSAAIVWSPEQNPYDAWHHFQVEAVAQNQTVTVFVYTYPEYRSQDNNVYIDDASLVAIAPPPTNTPRPTNTPLPTRTPQPPTATPLPTETPAPTGTPIPTETPVPPTSTPVPPTATSAPTAPPAPTATPTPASFTARLTSGSGPAILLSGLVGIAIVIAVGTRLFRRNP